MPRWLAKWSWIAQEHIAGALPGRLHLCTCPFCRGGMAWIREQER